ncbi:RagB/SusD family nutrient uptake outer membrane protein [Zobellia sp. OII3]|nr:RagB/SusD family nutrient uptake outer membrane protein [Zobellia sp. OII3]
MTLTKVLTIKNFVRTVLPNVLSLCILTTSSCSDFVEIDTPTNTLVAETVFEDASTVESALANLYYTMREEGMVSGRYGLSALMGIYSDELDYYKFDPYYLELYHHNVTASNALLSGWWSNAYHLIFATNDIIAGMEDNTNLSLEDQARFKGEALFVRAYMHSLLVALYGDIPYITTTNYATNNTVSRMPLKEVYEHILADLTESVDLLSNDTTDEKVVPDQSTAKALLARIYLYTENWALAESTASKLIDSFNLEPEVQNVFLKESKETIWQFKPNGISDHNTYEANEFVIQFVPGQTYALGNDLLNTFEPGDLRKVHWTRSLSSADESTSLHFAHKYKALLSQTESLEYSIVFRLAEQYLIRAEARAQLGKINGAKQDLNVIRNRAGLANTTTITKDGLLEAILKERFTELFTEQGHRWFDLQRTGTAPETLSAIKADWNATDVLLPIPSTELEINQNLKPQNPGY